MAEYNQAEAKHIFIGKLEHGADLLEELTAICKEKDIHLGKVEALGAVQKARLGYYNQDAKEYSFFELNKNLEITSLIGNISLRDGQPMVHAHITVSDSDGKAFGGHLAPGTIVFACEFVITTLDGPQLTRDHDEQTALPLWKM
jgi:predicted DNA-binding protein with PD1-like motif